MRFESTRGLNREREREPIRCAGWVGMIALVTFTDIFSQFNFLQLINFVINLFCNLFIR